MNYGLISVIPGGADFEAIKKEPKLYARRCFLGYKAAKVTNLERLAQAITKCVWSPCIFKNGYRTENNFLASDWCVLDIDAPGFSLNDAIDKFQDVVHLIGTTKSHQKDKNGIVCDRFRICLKFEKTITDLDTYRHNLSQIVKELDADQKCVDGARLFWPCVDIISSFHDLEDGYTIEVLDSPPRKKIDYSEIHKHFGENRQVQPWVKFALEHGCQNGERNTTCFKVAYALGSMGYTQEQILRRLMNSPIPIDNSARVEKEVFDTILSAFKNLRKKVGAASHA